MKRGTFIEYWQAWLNPGRPPQAADGYVLDSRNLPAVDGPRQGRSREEGAVEAGVGQFVRW
ncbi:MAG: hypothetical protein ABIO65_01740, partial [Nitrospiria bacterium]